MPFEFNSCKRTRIPRESSDYYRERDKDTSYKPFIPNRGSKGNESKRNISSTLQCFFEISIILLKNVLPPAYIYYMLAVLSL